MNGWTVLAAASATAAVILLRPPRRWLVTRRLGLPGREERRKPWRSGGRRPDVRLVGAGVVVVAVVVLAGATAQVLAGATVAGVGLFVLQQVRAQRAREAREATRVDVCSALDLLAAELRGGILPDRAIASAAQASVSLRDGVPALQSGGDVATVLRHAAGRPGAQAWSALASGWTVAERAGAPLADVVERVADTVRDDLELAREVTSEAAPARATGRLMSVLPVLGLGLGAGMGADPVHLLTSTVPGALCLASGAALACLGTWWVDRVVDSAQEDS